jgi:hypothetical protein
MRGPKDEPESLDHTGEGGSEITTSHGKRNNMTNLQDTALVARTVIDVIPRTYRKGGKTGRGGGREGEKKAGSGKGSVTDLR